MGEARRDEVLCWVVISLFDHGWTIRWVKRHLKMEGRLLYSDIGILCLVCTSGLDALSLSLNTLRTFVFFCVFYITTS